MEKKWFTATFTGPLIAWRRHLMVEFLNKHSIQSGEVLVIACCDGVLWISYYAEKEFPQ